MDAIQQIVLGFGHSVVELGRKMEDELYFINFRSLLKNKRHISIKAPQILLSAIEKIPLLQKFSLFLWPFLKYDEVSFFLVYLPTASDTHSWPQSECIYWKAPELGRL